MHLVEPREPPQDVCRDRVPRGGGVVAVLLLQPVEQAAERQLVVPRRGIGAGWDLALAWIGRFVVNRIAESLNGFHGLGMDWSIGVVIQQLKA